MHGDRGTGKGLPERVGLSREDREEVVVEGKEVPELMTEQKRLAGYQHVGCIEMAPWHTFER